MLNNVFKLFSCDLHRLYDNMGILFHFASNDMRARVRALQTLNKENPAVYSAVVTALDHEKAEGVKKKTKSGAKAASVVLMEMHWDVAFIMNIMQVAKKRDFNGIVLKCYFTILAAWPFEL